VLYYLHIFKQPLSVVWYFSFQFLFKQNSNGKDQEDETGDANMAGDDVDSELNLAWGMLDLARRIVEQKPDDNTMQKAKILLALAEVSMERGGQSYLSN
jgi:hypothetical protein